MLDAFLSEPFILFILVIDGAVSRRVLDLTHLPALQALVGDEHASSALIAQMLCASTRACERSSARCQAACLHFQY